MTGAAAVMLARGALGNPWLFAQLLGRHGPGPTRAEVLAELHWTMQRAVEHLGEGRATRYLRKFYPWYLARLELEGEAARRMQQSLPSWRRRLRGPGSCSSPSDWRSRRSPESLAGERSGRSWTRLGPRYTPALAEVPGPRHPPRERGFPRRRPNHEPAIEGHMPKDVILTPEGLTKLKDELELLSTAKRREVAERIKEAREFGDISENSEYDDAKNEQAMLESRIAQLRGEATDGDRDPGQRALDRRCAGRLGGACQGREDGQVGEVHDRRLGGGQARRSTSSPTSRPWVAL